VIVGDPILHAEGLEKTLGTTTVFDGLDLDIDRDRITVIIGPNGAGKTVLLCCLAGGLEPDVGTISVDGRPMGPAARRRLSFLPQDTMAIDHLTGRENARFFTRLHPAGPDRWQQLIPALDLEADLDATVRTYSGGMVRKLELAIALDPDVPLYLFDEPTAGVDLTRITRFHDLLLREVSDGKTIVLSSHTPIDMELADTIVVVKDGRIGVTGSPSELLERLPDILRVRGRVGRLADRLARHVIKERWYVRGDEIRGFLRPELDPDRAERTLADEDGIIDVTVEAPSFVDLFNFHTDRALLDSTGRQKGVDAEWP